MISIQELQDKEQTGQEMYKLVDRFSADVDAFQINGRPLSAMPFTQYYNMVRDLPFKKDIPGIEVVTRPFHVFSTPFKGLDCKKKSIALASWLQKNNIPWRFKAVSRRPDKWIHHVIVQAKSNRQWNDVDATYPYNYLGQPQKWTNQEILPKNGAGTLTDSPKLISIYGIDAPSRPMQYEFIRKLRQVSPEEMGAAGSIIAAIIAGVTVVTGAVIGAVSSKRQQDRQLAAAKSARLVVTTEEEKAAAAAQEQAEKIQDIAKIAIPGAAAAALIFMTR